MPFLYTLVEGQTEERFFREVLSAHLAEHGVYAPAPQLFRTGRKRGHNFRGGVVSYAKVKSEIARMAAAKNRGSYITTMLDYYALPGDFPGRAEAKRFDAPIDKVRALEAAFGADVQPLGNHLGDNWFCPYIQLHEFEALIFVHPQMLNSEFPEHEDAIRELQSNVQGLAAEEINDGDQTAPSKRIIRFVPQYDGRKVEAGPRVAAMIGLDVLQEGAPHFRGWLETLRSLR